MGTKIMDCRAAAGVTYDGGHHAGGTEFTAELDIAEGDWHIDADEPEEEVEALTLRFSTWIGPTRTRANGVEDLFVTLYGEDIDQLVEVLLHRHDKQEEL